jgi:hypothetical protein
MSTCPPDGRSAEWPPVRRQSPGSSTPSTRRRGPPEHHRRRDALSWGSGVSAARVDTRPEVMDVPRDRCRSRDQMRLGLLPRAGGSRGTGSAQIPHRVRRTRPGAQQVAGRHLTWCHPRLSAALLPVEAHKHSEMSRRRLERFARTASIGSPRRSTSSWTPPGFTSLRPPGWFHISRSAGSSTVTPCSECSCAT